MKLFLVVPVAAMICVAYVVIKSWNEFKNEGDCDMVKVLSFKEAYLDMQNIIYEIKFIRDYNFANRTGRQVCFLEAAGLCMGIERILRIVPAIGAKEKESLDKLIMRAFGYKNPLFQSFNPFTSQLIINTVIALRNGIDHANFEQLARRHNLSIDQYFKNQFYIDMDDLYQILQLILIQIDNQTGQIMSGTLSYCQIKKDFILK